MVQGMNMNKIPKALLFENEEAKPMVYDLKLFTINIYNRGRFLKGGITLFQG